MSNLNRLGALATLLNDRLDEAFDDLSPRATSILLTLFNRGSLQVSILGKIIGTTQPTATRLIDGLEKIKLVERGQRVGRAISVSLTRQGRNRAENIQKIRRDCIEDLCSCLTADEQRLLVSLIDKMLFTNTMDRLHARTICRYCDHGLCHGHGCPANRKATEIELSVQNQSNI